MKSDRIRKERKASGIRKPYTKKDEAEKVNQRQKESEDAKRARKTIRIPENLLDVSEHAIKIAKLIAKSTEKRVKTRLFHVFWQVLPG